MSVIDKIQINSTTYDVAAGAGNVAYSDAATYPDGSAGKEISQLKSETDKLNAAISSPVAITWEQGSIDLSGNIANDSGRIRTANYIDLDADVSVSNDAAYSIRFYNASNEYVGGTSVWITTPCKPSEKTSNANAAKCRIVMKAISGGDITPTFGSELTVTEIKNPYPQIAALENLTSAIYSATATDAGKALKAKTVNNGKVEEWEFGAIPVIDSTLAISGQAADAKATGDLIATDELAISALQAERIYTFPSSWELGGLNSDGTESSGNNRIRSNYFDFDVTNLIDLGSGVKYTIRLYDENQNRTASTGWITKTGTLESVLHLLVTLSGNEKYIRFSMAYSDDAVISNVSLVSSKFTIYKTVGPADAYERAIKAESNGHSIVHVNSTGLGNCSIRCAKEQSYADGSYPQIEWFLLEEAGTNKFYYSADLKDKEYLFTFPGDAYKYSFGVLQNGDIIGCLDADSIETDDKNDSNRVNPYVFIASEHWSVAHIVNFGDSIKPCGWLENCGFKVLADGSAIFCEYTRQTTATANVWKLSGDPLNKANWAVKKSFVVTSTDNLVGFKHCHMVTQDFYNGICYLATGDDNTGAMLYYSSDNGNTWTQLRSPDSTGDVDEHGWYAGSEKYCRMLMLTFTKDYIYWATDAYTQDGHYLFKARRDNNGVLDYTTVVDWVQIPLVNYAATYGTSLIPELNAILLLDRTDGAATEMPVRMVTLADGELHTIGYLYTNKNSPSGTNLGFRTRFSEWYPYNGLVRVGYDVHENRHNRAVNYNGAFNNNGYGYTGSGRQNINNLYLQVYKAGSDYGFHLGTYYI